MRLSAEGREPVHKYTTEQLHRFLVEDAVKHHATDLRWAVAAYVMIGGRKKGGAEKAMLDVLDEVEQLTGMRRMPL